MQIVLGNRLDIQIWSSIIIASQGGTGVSSSRVFSTYGWYLKSLTGGVGRGMMVLVERSDDPVLASLAEERIQQTKRTGGVLKITRLQEKTCSNPWSSTHTL